jgi:hypothetical protein
VFVTYTPDEGDKCEWEFKPGRVKASEQAIMEKRTGLSWTEWLTAVKKGPGPARRALIWHLMRRDGHNVRWEDIDPFDDEVLVEQSVAELIENRDSYIKAGGPDLDENAAYVMAMFERELADARAKFGDDGPGKAPSRNGPPDTSG